MSNVSDADMDVSAPSYSLTVLNQNSQFQRFALFQASPRPDASFGNVSSLIWMLGAAAPGSPDSPSRAIFTWQTAYSAVLGQMQAHGTSADPQRFMAQTSVGVGLTGNNLVPASYIGDFPQGVLAFPDAPTDGPQGVVTVMADGSIPNASQQSSDSLILCVGLAMSDRAVLATQIYPQIRFQMSPRLDYYIMAGSFEVGQVVDASTAASAFGVTFGGTKSRTIVFTPDGTFASPE